MTNHTTDPVDESDDRTTFGRRSVLKATGLSATLPAIAGVATARGSSGTQAGGEKPTDDARPPVIHSQFGYPVSAEEEVPDRLSPDETVELHVDEERIDDTNLPELTVEFGAFHFTPVGLQVDPGAIVAFDFQSPEHTTTAFHTDQERQQRVPNGVPAFTSTVNVHGGVWLYRFEAEGVYDLFCAPHEWGGMGMRIVVGDDPGDVVRAPGRPPLPMTAALLGSGLPPDEPAIGPPPMAPENIVENGPITLDDLGIELAVTMSAPSPP